MSDTLEQREYWRSLEERGRTAAPDARADEFPPGAAEWTDGVGRRDFLKIMAASLALGGATACSRPDDPILPYAQQPEQVVPGKPLFFATAMTLGGVATGVLVESHMGRPTKVEGNPTHPASLGATDVFAQASILDLYDPDRSQTVLRDGNASTWERLVGLLADVLGAQGASRGGGLRILTQTVTSPTLAAQLRAFLARYPNARWHQYEPTSAGGALAAARAAFGTPLQSVYRVDQAAVILALGADFLGTGRGALRYAREFTAGRKVRTPQDRMNRLYAAESGFSPTGSIADHRLPVRAGHMEALARAVARRVGVAGVGGDDGPVAPHAKWLDAVAKDLAAHRGASLVVPGEQQSPAVHVLVHAINQTLGNDGRTVVYTDPIEAEPADQVESLRTLVGDMQAGTVEALFILGGNPVFTAPADLQFEQAVGKVGLRVHLSQYEDETSARCQWHVPETHYLESWGDARAFDGTVSLVQPLIAPLVPSRRSVHEFLAALLGDAGRSAYDVVRDYWRGQHPGADFEQFWRKALHDGVVPGTALPPRSVALRAGALAQAGAPTGPAGDLEIVFRPDPGLWDGRFANNGWLQEMPRPFTTLTWDNPLLIAPQTAERLGLANEDVVELSHGGRTLRAPVWVQPGQAADSLTLHLGYGRERGGRVAAGTGVNVYRLRASTAMWTAAGARVQKTGERVRLAATHAHHSLAGRPLIRSAALAAYRRHPDFAHEAVHAPAHDETLYPNYPYEGHAWAMAIDLSACTGCGACVVACQAENNIPVVGKAQVLRGREMHWLRIDHYYTGGAETPEPVNMPVPCMHCENAPCEPVCPVGATVHSSEGLNDMVYNRCVGTRYCSNNCPYKVRRFNFLQYSDDRPLLQLQQNPDVTVRSRGVMEKCTYCVQRISAARITAEREGRSVRDGEVVTACAAACPTRAIVFGDRNDRRSAVAGLQANSLTYGLLAELNTRPRTTYLAQLRNPNPEIEAA